MYRKLIIPIVFLVLIGAFFGNSIVKDKVVNGIDGNYANRYVEKLALEEGGYGHWSTESWLGKGDILPLKSKFLFRDLFSMRWELVASLATSIFIALLFMFLLLRKFDLERIPAAFGAIAYAFTPHFLTLIYPCHLGSMNSIAYTPALFYFITLAFETGSETKYKRWTATLLAGLAWGMAINEDPQRGLYVSAAAAAYLLYRIWNAIPRDGLKLKSGTSRQLLYYGARLGLIAVVFFLTFYHNFQQQMGGKHVVDGPAGVEQNQKAESAEKRWAFATSWSLNPKELADSIAPGYHGNLTGDPEKPYWGSRPVAHSSDALGFFVVMFGLLGAAAGFRKERNIRFFLIAALFATLLAFGKYMPGRPLFWLWYQLPMMDKFRAPGKFMCVSAFSMAILSGYGLQYLMVSLRKDTRLAVYTQRTLLALLGIGIVWILAVVGNEHVLRAEVIQQKLRGNEELARQAYSNTLLSLFKMNFYILCSLLVLWLARRFKNFPHRTQLTAYIFALFLVFDLFSIDQFYLQKSLFEPAEFFVRDEVVDTVDSRDEPARVTTSLKIEHQGRMVPLSLTAAGNHYTTYLFPYFQIDSFDATPQARVARDYRSLFAGMLSGPPQTRNPQQLVQRLIESNLRLWRLCNVKYLVTDGHLYGMSRQPLPIMDALQNADGLRLVGKARGVANRDQIIFAIEDALPRFAFYRNFAAVSNNQEALDMLKDPDFDIERRAVVATEESDLQANGGDENYTAPQVEEYHAGYARLEVDAPSDGFLIMNSRYDKDWQAKVDGEAVDTFRANFIMTGIFVPEGSHTVEFEFAPASGTIRISVLTIIATLVAAAVLAFLQVLSRRTGKDAGGQG